MPFTIIRHDITTLDVDAIVNAANPSLLGGGGVDGAIHRAAGPGLLEECRALNGCPTGEAKITGGHRLKARYVIHTVGPVWHGGDQGERALLAACYRNSLNLALEKGCESVAFPLISAGAYGYPKDEAMAVAAETIEQFLAEHDMAVTLVLFGSTEFLTGRQLFRDVQAYIDDVYVDARVNHPLEHHRHALWQRDPDAALGMDAQLGAASARPDKLARPGKPAPRKAKAAKEMEVDWGDLPSPPELAPDSETPSSEETLDAFLKAEKASAPVTSDEPPKEAAPASEEAAASAPAYIPEPWSEEALFTSPELYQTDDGLPLDMPAPDDAAHSDHSEAPDDEESAPATPPDWEALLRRTDEGFSEALLRLIDERGMTDAQCYKRANVDRKLFSKIRSNPAYRPSKPTVFAFAIALELTLPEAVALLGKAGFALSHSSKFDIVLEYFLKARNYNLYEINEVLFQFDMPLLGSSAG